MRSLNRYSLDILNNAAVSEQYCANVRNGGYNTGDFPTISHTWVRSELHRIQPAGPAKHRLVQPDEDGIIGRRTGTRKNYFSVS